MVILTIAIALIGIALVLNVQYCNGLGLLAASIVLYPEYMRVPMGFAQMSVPRFIAMALILKWYKDKESPRFQWTWADRLVLIWWCWDVLANALNGAGSSQMIWVVGRCFDTVLMYFAARLALMSGRSLRGMISVIAVAVTVMGLVGVCEMFTHYSPYHALEGYYAWAHLGLGVEDDVRYGLLRARGSSGQPASFGLSLIILSGILYAYRRYASHPRLLRVAILLGMAGVASSLSSGPMVALFVFLAGSALYAAPKLIIPVIILGIIACVAAELFSHRRFYYLIEYLNVFGGDYWYRCKLMDVAIQELPSYWLLGYGARSANYWGPMIDGRDYVDLVNQYIGIAISGGLGALVAYIGFQVSAIRRSVKHYQNASASGQRIASYHIGALVVAVMFSGFQLSLLGAPNLLAFILVGMAATGIGGGKSNAGKEKGRSRRDRGGQSNAYPSSFSALRPNHRDKVQAQVSVGRVLVRAPWE